MPNHTYKDEGSSYELSISDIDSESDKLFAISERQLDEWEKKAKDTYIASLISAVWAAISGGEITGVAKTKTEITVDAMGVTARPRRKDIDYWKEVLHRIAKQESEELTPLDHCKNEEGLDAWLREVSDDYEGELEEVATAFRVLKQKCVQFATVWDAAYYIDADKEYPIPDAWEIHYIIPDTKDTSIFFCNIYKKGGNEVDGKWIVLNLEFDEWRTSLVSDKQAEIFDAAVYTAVTAGEGFDFVGFCCSPVYVYSKQ